MIRRMSTGLVLCGMLLAVVDEVKGGGNGPRDFAGRCESCHLVAPQEGQKGIFIADIDFLCRQCHEVKERNSHPSEILPSMSLPDGNAT